MHIKNSFYNYFCQRYRPRCRSSRTSGSAAQRVLLPGRPWGHVPAQPAAPRQLSPARQLERAQRGQHHVSLGTRDTSEPGVPAKGLQGTARLQLCVGVQHRGQGVGLVRDGTVDLPLKILLSFCPLYCALVQRWKCSGIGRAALWPCL